MQMTIAVRVDQGRRVENIFVDGFVGDFAVHKAVHGGLPVGPGFTVTHTQSGVAVWITRELVGALRVAQMLDEKKLIPALDHAEMIAWRDALTGPQRAEIQFAMQSTAPRLVPDSVS